MEYIQEAGDNKHVYARWRSKNDRFTIQRFNFRKGGEVSPYYSIYLKASRSQILVTDLKNWKQVYKFIEEYDK